MAKVYLSSTVVDLKAERDAISRWLIAAGHQPVHSYVADSETVRASCLADIDQCDLYLLILGHRYGYVPEADNPGGLSITHLEFRRAGERGLPRIVLMRTSVPDIQQSDLLDAARNQRLQAFHAEVRQAVRPAEFNDEADLIAALSTGVQRALEKAPAGEASRAAEQETTPVAASLARHAAGGTRPPTPPRPDDVPGRSGGWWATVPGLLTGAAAVIAAISGLIALFVPQREAPPPEPPALSPATLSPASSPAPVASGPASQEAPALPRLVLVGATEVSFDKSGPSTYSVLTIETQPRTPSHYRVRFRLRLLTRSSMDMNFWDRSFRLLVDGLPTAPDSDLNEVVPGNAAKEADVIFQVPYGARNLALRIIQHQELGDVADLPLRLAADKAAAEAVEAQPGSQSVKTGDIGAGARVNIQQRQ